jgi:hypothetical protein
MSACSTILAVLVLIGQSQPDPRAENLTPFPNGPKLGTLASPNGDEVVIMRKVELFQKQRDAARDGTGRDFVMKAVASLDIMPVPDRTQARALGYAKVQLDGKDMQFVQVEVTAGPAKGYRGWVLYPNWTVDDHATATEKEYVNDPQSPPSGSPAPRSGVQSVVERRRQQAAAKAAARARAQARQQAAMQAQMEYERQMAPYVLMQQQLQLQAQTQMQRQQMDAYRLQLQERAVKALERSVTNDTIRSGGMITRDPRTGEVVPYGR